MTWCDLWVWALERITVPCHFSRSRVQSYFPFIVQPQTPQEKWGAREIPESGHKSWQLADYVHGEAGERVKKWAIMLGNINRSSCITVQDKDRQYSMHANSALKAERVHDYCSTLCLCLQQKKKCWSVLIGYEISCSVLSTWLNSWIWWLVRRCA